MLGAREAMNYARTVGHEPLLLLVSCGFHCRN